MEIKDKLRELRKKRNLTQETVAEHLGISPQTVSKWERGLLSPDIHFLPKLAVLYRCSIDSIFDMESAWGIEHRKEFEAYIHDLFAKKDYENIYRALLCEIELQPDCFLNYQDVMRFVLQKKMFGGETIRQMLSLAEYAEKYCPDGDVRNEIYKLMLQICANSNTSEIKAKANEYFRKLPMLRHSREIYAGCVMEDDGARQQIKENIIYTIDLAECSIRQLITPEMPPEEQLYYYKKAARLLETVFDGKYAGFYDVQLLCDYAQMVSLLVRMKEFAQASEYMNYIFKVLERHFTKGEQDCSALISGTNPRNATPAEASCKKLLDDMLGHPNFELFKTQISEFSERYHEYFKR